jgi:hypothetical protein
VSAAAQLSVEVKPDGAGQVRVGAVRAKGSYSAPILAPTKVTIGELAVITVTLHKCPWKIHGSLSGISTEARLWPSSHVRGTANAGDVVRHVADSSRQIVRRATGRGPRRRRSGRTMTEPMPRFLLSKKNMAVQGGARLQTNYRLPL